MESSFLVDVVLSISIYCPVTGNFHDSHRSKPVSKLEIKAVGKILKSKNNYKLCNKQDSNMNLLFIVLNVYH